MKKFTSQKKLMVGEQCSYS